MTLGDLGQFARAESPAELIHGNSWVIDRASSQFSSSVCGVHAVKSLTPGNAPLIKPYTPMCTQASG